MLSLRGARRESGGVADDAEELEEGEARSDDDAFFDPDIALSYIDEKLQNVLGHFQKEFEGGVSAEGLGSKFGGYGSFLPTYEHSPLLPQSRSPHIAANIGTSRSLYQPSAERMDQKSSTVAVGSISRKNSSRAPSTGYLQKKERFSSTNDEESVAGSDSVDSSFNCSDSKSLEVQTKVCSKDDLPRNKPAIYSGMGLDISSSSSMEESPDNLGGLSPEFSNVPYESPRTILQVMTCFAVPGGFLVSPLCVSWLQLTNKGTPMLKNWKTHSGMDNVPRELEGRSQSPRPPGPFRGHVDKKMKLISREKVPMDTKTRKDKGDTSEIVNNEVNIQMHASQEIISDIPASKEKIKRDSQCAKETTINKCISAPSQQNYNDLATVKSVLIKAETLKYTENNSVDNSRTGKLTPKRRPKIKMGDVSIDLEERDLSHHKPSLFDRKRKGKVKSERKFEAAIADCDYNDSRTMEQGVSPCDDLRNIPLKKAFSSNRTGDGHSRTEFKRMHEECHGSASASYDLMEDDNYTNSSAADMDRENATELKSCHFEKKAKSQSNLGETLSNRCQGDMEGGLEDKSAQGELHQKDKIVNTNYENEFDVGYARKQVPTSVKHGNVHMLSTSGACMSKIKNKRGINQDEQETCKKNKMGGWRQIDRGSGAVQRLGMSFKKERFHLRFENQDIRNPVPQVVNLPKKVSKQKICPTSVKSDSLKMKTELIRSNMEVGVQHGIVKQAVSNPSDMNPVKKDGNMVAFTIKEARDLKHKADDLKNKGLELESIGLYFEAALKFMHVAFLLENPSFDSSRQGDVAQSIKMYSETAKLCKFCAYQYERFKKMVAAALAYKCVEVAHLKAAYYKHPSASKDLQELQAAVQIAPGESTSSYASDVDNLNRHGLSKASSRKGGNSPQVPGSHLPLAVHKEARLLRLLAYTNNVNLAFDATRKSELVIASAAGSHERGEGGDYGLASVKRVLGLNFSNVNELLRLVRVSMESIGC